MERDAGLSWQYFGATNGFLRRFPGTQWPTGGASEKKSINDFRTQDWFIQAASSPKDIVSFNSFIFYSEEYSIKRLTRIHTDDTIGCFWLNVGSII